MRRSELIQIGILAVALISGYKFLETLIGVIITAMLQFKYSAGNSISFIIEYLVFLVIYFTGFYLLIRFNRQLADYIDRQGNKNRVADSENINIRINGHGLLYVVIIALSIITLLQEIPALAVSMFNYFKKEVGGETDRVLNDVEFKTGIIRFVLALIVLFFAQPISNWFSRQTTRDEMIMEANGGTSSHDSDQDA